MSFASHSRQGAPCRAALDIGSNTVMSLATLEADGRVRTDGEWFETTRLAQGTRRDGSLTEDARRRTLEAIRSQVRQLQERYASGRGYAVATSAVRKAANGQDFLDECASVIGGRPVCLDGEQEARFTWRGAVSDVADGTAVLQVDIGGGSTEVSVGAAGADCDRALSVDMGCVGLTERFHLDETIDRKRRAAVSAAIDEVLLPALAGLGEDLVQSPRLLVGSGGAVTTFAAMDQHLETYDAEHIHGYATCREDVRRALERLSKLDAAGRSELAGVPEDRAAILPAGLLILDGILALCGSPRVRVSTRGLRFGIALALAAEDIPCTWSW